jgi:exonuclease I
MAKQIISRTDLEEDVKALLTVSQIARKRKASKSSVSERCKRLGLSPVGSARNPVVPAQGVDISMRGDPVSQLRKINGLTLEILEKAMASLRTSKKVKDPLGVCLRSMKEIRGQIETEFSILQGLHDMELREAEREFREEVLQILGEVDQNVKDELIKRLEERKLARRAISGS